MMGGNGLVRKAVKVSIHFLLATSECGLFMFLLIFFLFTFLVIVVCNGLYSCKLIHLVLLFWEIGFFDCI